MKAFFLFASIALLTSCSAQKTTTAADDAPIITGADRIQVYMPYLKGKKVGIFANQTSIVGNTHLVDTLMKSGVDIQVIFGPEHGFRGTADAGEKVGTI